MAGQNLTQFDAVLKEFYGPGIVEELNQTVPFLALIEKDAGLIKFDGREFLVPIHTGRNSGIGARAEGAVLPTAGAQTYVDYKIKPTYQYGGIKVTGQVIQQSRTDKGAFGRAVQLEMEGLRNNLRTDLNFQFQRNGVGTRGVIASGTASATQTVAANGNSGAPGIAYDMLNEGMVVDIYDSTGTTSRATGLTVNSVVLDPTTWNVTSVTLSSSVTTTTGDIIIRSGNLNAEILGLDAIVGSGSYGGINSSNYAVWQSAVLGNSGTLRPINDSLFQSAIDVAEKAGGGMTKYFFTTPEIRKNFYLYLANNRRVVNTKKYEGGFESVEYDGKEIFVDRMCNANTMYGIDPSYLYRVETRELHWIDDDGTILHRSFDNTDTYFANMRYYVNLAATKRNAFVKISDIQQ